MDTKAAYLRLFPICLQKQYLNDRLHFHNDELLRKTENDVDTDITEFCEDYGNYPDSDVCVINPFFFLCFFYHLSFIQTALREWKMVDIYPSITSKGGGSSNPGKIKGFFIKN